MTQDIKEIVNKVIIDVTKDTNFKGTSDLEDDLGIDSLSVIDLVVSLENYFKIYIEDDDFENWSTVNDIYDSIEHQLISKQNK